MAFTAEPLAPEAAPAAPRRRPAPPWDGSQAPYRIQETRWGFRVAGRGGEPLLQALARVAALLAGTAGLAAAVTLLLRAETGGATWPIRVGLAALIGGVGLLLVWFSTRGTVVETEVDTLRGELRLVVRNRIGPMARVATYGLDAVSGVRVARMKGGHGRAILAVELAGGQALLVAAGAEAALVPLRRRIEREVMVGVQRLGWGDAGAEARDEDAATGALTPA